MKSKQTNIDDCSDRRHIVQYLTLRQFFCCNCYQINICIIEHHFVYEFVSIFLVIHPVDIMALRYCIQHRNDSNS